MNAYAANKYDQKRATEIFQKLTKGIFIQALAEFKNDFSKRLKEEK